VTTDKSLSAAQLVFVYDGRECCGFVLSRGPRGFEALTGSSGEQSLGLFESQD
jgi:hypothetical protein